jgi:DNA sulfur modification protein DndC
MNARAETTFLNAARQLSNAQLDALEEETIFVLREVAAAFERPALLFSGGKDSSATVTAVVHLIATGRVKPPKSLTVLYADTRMELPPLHECAMRILGELRERGIKTWRHMR